MSVLMGRQRGAGGGMGRKGCCFPETTVPPSGLLLLGPGAFPCQPLPPSGAPPKLGIVQKFMSVSLKNWHLTVELRVSSWPQTHLNFQERQEELRADYPSLNLNL